MAQHAPYSAARKPPIFVVGCQRSGTTLFRLILDSHPNIACGPETRFLAEMASVTGTRDWPRISRYGMTREWWHSHIANFFDHIQTTYAQSRGCKRWADKSPVYALHLDFIDHLYPDCLVINVVRDARAVVRSHRDTWGYRSAIGSVDKWIRYIAAAEGFGRRVGPSRYLQVRYEDLTRDTDGVMQSVMEFINEPWDDALLHHADYDHDVMPSHEEHASRRRGIGPRGSVFSSTVSGRKRLDPLLASWLWWRARSTLRRLGY